MTYLKQGQTRSSTSSNFNSNQGLDCIDSEPVCNQDPLLFQATSSNLLGFKTSSEKLPKAIVTKSGITERGKSKYKVHLGKRQIGIIVHSSPNCFGAALSPLFGEEAETFCDRELAVSWLLARYLEWRDKPISIERQNYCYVIRHGCQYIGSLYFKEDLERWVATVDSPHSKVD